MATASPTKQPTSGEKPSANPKSTLSLAPTSTLGIKYAVGLTGILLSGFVIFHMLGNLQIFLPPHFINDYAHFLKSNLELLVPARLGLLLVFVVHLGLAMQLRIRNASARKTDYQYPRQYQESTVSSRSMIITGLALLFFVVYHLSHFTMGWIQPADYAGAEANLVASKELGHVDSPNVFKMVNNDFIAPWNGGTVIDSVITASYLLAMVFLGLHMWHGVASAFQSLGVNAPRWKVWTRSIGYIATIIVIAGNVLIVTLTYLGLPKWLYG
ncbi:MAG: succinate dehydrogenase cytochrome b subunit [Gemmataceae bacterium]